PNCSSSSAGIAGNSAGMAFGLRGICSPWDKNMPRTQNYGQAHCCSAAAIQRVEPVNKSPVMTFILSLQKPAYTIPSARQCFVIRDVEKTRIFVK
ncbi:hypothetical protein, partial [Burkholderia gladioli]|uniref:hypothetical protein n=1 Tax=Burkholderia gladioli TaxID=28095 RepID=UPI001ABA49D2